MLTLSRSSVETIVSNRPSLRARSFDGITRRQRVDLPPESQPSTASWGGRAKESVVANLPQPIKPAKQPRRNYFDETPAERRERRQRARDEEVAESKQRTKELFAAGDNDGLFQHHFKIVLTSAHRVQWRCGCDDFTVDDLTQAGSIGLWNAIKTYDPDRPASFHTHATRCVVRRVWQEFSRLKDQQKRGFSTISDELQDSMSTQNPPVESELADTESIAIIRRCLRALPENARLILQYRSQGESLEDIGRAMGMTLSGAHTRYWWAIDQIQQMVLPLSSGAWTPFPYLARDAWADFDEAIGAMAERLPPLIEPRSCEQCGKDISGTTKRAKFCCRPCYRRNLYLTQGR